MKWNKKGSLIGFLDNMQFIFVLIISLVFVIGFIYFAVVAGPLISGSASEAATEIRSAISNTDNNTEIGNATVTTTTIVIDVMGKMELLVYALFFGLFLGFVVVAYEVKFYPFLSFAWIALMIVVVLFAIVVSNSYQEDIAAGPTSEFYSTWGNVGWLMVYLPHIFAALGLISAILLFALQTRSPDEDVTTGSVNL